MIDLDRNGETISGPARAADRGSWLHVLCQWRDQQKADLKYDDSLYRRPEFAWCRRNFVQPQMMIEDRYFYDPVTRKYTVDKYLDDLDTRYGGIDSVLIWPVYPNVGIDDRSQHDLLRDMPGGLAGVRQMIDDFHRRGVQVLFPMMPWEAGTRQDPLPLADAVARDFDAAGIDGVNGDTMGGIGQKFLQAAEAVHHPLAFEPELGLHPLATIQWDAMSWGYWNYGSQPVVDAYKWVEPRHLTNVCERWAKDHIPGLQSAFLNGDGFESWENVWGIWNGITPRNAEAIRRVATIERGFADLLVSPDWEPYVPTSQPGVFASMFPGPARTVWFLVNRSDQNTDGDQITVPYTVGSTYYDFWNGRRITPRIEGATAALSFPIEAHGFGAVLACREDTLPDDLQKVLSKMAELSPTKLSALSNAWAPLPQTLVDIPPTEPALLPPDGMVLIPAGSFNFKINGVEIEGSGPGVDVQYPWEQFPTKHHEHALKIQAFYIDKFPVTNEQFKKFVDTANYHPADDHNFLKDWANGTYLGGWAKKPVTWVSLEDARAYAAWAGKRLPHEWEWQYAAQGLDGRPYPWGMKADASALPSPDTGHDLTGPSEVDAFPRGASSFGVMDLVGNVWQWTDEYQDEHTRAAILRGDGYYHPQGSSWYFPHNQTLDQHGKYLLMCPGKDRAGTIGFRCVKDVAN